VARAFVEQPDDVRVELVNRLAMFGNVHGNAECRIMKEESNLFREANSAQIIFLEAKLVFNSSARSNGLLTR
jgi:hypothetical protein